LVTTTQIRTRFGKCMKPKKSKIVEPLKLEFGAGRRPQPGFKSVDLYAPEADFKVDLFKFPLPWKDNTVEAIFASHFIEHIPQKLRWPFFDECWRIMKNEGVMQIVVPSWKSERAYGDMTHEWPPVTAMSFFYLNKKWREDNKLTYGDYNLKCNFEPQAGAGPLASAFSQKHESVQQFAAVHYLEAYGDMWATLTKKPT